MKPEDPPASHKIQHQEQTLENTSEPEKNICFGDFLSEEDLKSPTIQKIIQLANYQFLHNYNKFMILSIVLSSGHHIDLRISRPYLIRVDKKGALQEVYCSIPESYG